MRDGQKCPKCGCMESKVVDSRPGHGPCMNYRRRICKECKHAWRTVELYAREAAQFDTIAKEAAKVIRRKV